MKFRRRINSFISCVSIVPISRGASPPAEDRLPMDTSSPAPPPPLSDPRNPPLNPPPPAGSRGNPAPAPVPSGRGSAGELTGGVGPGGSQWEVVGEGLAGDGAKLLRARPLPLPSGRFSLPLRSPLDMACKQERASLVGGFGLRGVHTEHRLCCVSLLGNWRLKMVTKKVRG